MNGIRWCALVVALGWLGCGRLAAAEDFTGTTTVYRVRPGDTVPRICWQYKVRLEYVRAANPGLTEPLAAGQRLIIPLGPGPGTPADPPNVSIPAPVPVVVAPPEPRVRLASKVVAIAAAIAAPPPILVARAVSVSPPPPPLVPEPAVAAETPPAPEDEHGPAAVPPASGQAPVNAADFETAARNLAARGLRYNERWTPPGERQAWVMDCSNTSRYLYRTVAGLDIGRTASDQYYFLRLKKRARDVPTGWDHLPRIDFLRKHLRPGDLLFWENTYKPVRSPDITHVMVYLGEDADGRWQMAGSQNSAGVNIYRFDPQATKGGFSSWFGLVHHEGRFVAYGRPLDSL